MIETISFEEAWEKADAWGRVRLAMKAHELQIFANGLTGAGAWNSRNAVYQAISAWAKEKGADLP